MGLWKAEGICRNDCFSTCTVVSPSLLCCSLVAGGCRPLLWGLGRRPAMLLPAQAMCSLPALAAYFCDQLIGKHPSCACRERAIQKFNAEDSQVFIFLLSIRAAGRQVSGARHRR